MHEPMRRAAVLAAFGGAPLCSSPFSTGAQSVLPPPRMANEMPSKFTTSGSVEAPPGTLKLFDGLPENETAGKVYGNPKALQ